jgi:hypothetical protein
MTAFLIALGACLIITAVFLKRTASKMPTEAPTYIEKRIEEVIEDAGLLFALADNDEVAIGLRSLRVSLTAEFVAAFPAMLPADRAKLVDEVLTATAVRSHELTIGAVQSARMH